MVRSNQPKRIAFLDRDGVVNQELNVNGNPRSPRKIDEIMILEGVVKAVSILKSLDFVPVIVTNQPDVSRGFVSQTEVDRINQTVCNGVNIEHVYTCIHDASDNCDCRKPKNGLLLLAAKELSLSLENSIFIGDRGSDITAGHSVGSKCYLVVHGKSISDLEIPHIRVNSLLQAALKEKIKS